MADPKPMAELLLLLAEALSPFLVALVSYCAYQGANWLKQKTQSEKAASAIDRAAVAVSDVLAAGGSEFQAALRAAAEDGVITRAEVIALRDAALKGAKAQAGTEVMAMLKSMTEDPDEWLWTKIKAQASYSVPLDFDLEDLVDEEEAEDEPEDE